eukprot:CAMPEP_0198683036 /NCGR_PEP_ID=MMETSP1468-20131203/9903_1 /TAXON_ID=1461545 /ORGANISM="Mantoniella sp, Strain CCMP1436" /LENGTH=78 /DNA_ID=CAMNT_0044426653 /DNA_START=75 /DNA_END=311 /DNA_ORIENTATION=+
MSPSPPRARRGRVALFLVAMVCFAPRRPALHSASRSGSPLTFLFDDASVTLWPLNPEHQHHLPKDLDLHPISLIIYLI